MEQFPIDCTDEDLYAFARRWTDRLVAEDYAGAFDMLHYVPAHPGKSWVNSPELLRAWIVNYGSDEPIPGSSECVVTSPEAARGKPPRGFPYFSRDGDELYPGYRGSLDWPLPLNGEWSDLKASFDLIEQGGKLVPVLVALRVMDKAAEACDPPPSLGRLVLRWGLLAGLITALAPTGLYFLWAWGWGTRSLLDAPPGTPATAKDAMGLAFVFGIVFGLPLFAVGAIIGAVIARVKWANNAKQMPPPDSGDPC